MLPTPRATLLLVVTLSGFILLAGPALAEEPREAAWGTQDVRGSPVEAGFLTGGFFAVGVEDTGTVLTDEGPCAVSDADLYLFTFPGGDGCVDAVDATGDATGRDGVSALATAERHPRVLIAPVPSDSPTASGPDVVAYDVQGTNLTHAFERSVDGFITHLAANPSADRAVAIAQDDDTYRLHTFLKDGTEERAYVLTDQANAVSISQNARYASVAGETVHEGQARGWVDVYDLTEGNDANPITEHILHPTRGSIVNSTAVTNQGTAIAGSFDGTVTTLASDGSTRSVRAGNGTAMVDANQDGSFILAGSGETLTRYDDGLDEQWTRNLNGSIEDAFQRQGYVYAISEDTEAFHRDGSFLWSLPKTDVLAANRTGLGLALADATIVETATADLPASAVQAREAHRNATITQIDDVTNLSPGDTASVNLTVENTGAAVLTGSLAAPTGPLTVTFAPDTFTLLPGENRTVQAIVDAPRDQRAGVTDIPLELRSTPRVDADGTLKVDIGRTAQLDLRLEPGTLNQQAVVQGQTVTVHLLMTNRGNTDATATMSVHQTPTRGDAWLTTLSPRGHVTVPDGSTTSLTLETTVPEASEDGTVNPIIVRASTDTASTAARVLFTVNPFEALELEPDRITKTMGPGQTTPFTFSLTNLGSIATNVTLSASEVQDDGTLVGPGPWGIALDQDRVSLDPDEEGSLTVELTPPANASSGTIRVQVLATTQEGAQATSIAFGTVDPALASDDDEDPDRVDSPLPGLLALPALLVAWAVHRRTHDDNL